MPKEDYTKRLEELDKALKTTKEKAPKRGNSAQNQAAKVVSELLSGIIVGLFLGYQLDKYLSTTPLFIVILTILGVIGAFWNLYKYIDK